MIKYDYVLDDVSKTLMRVPITEYPTMDVLENGIKQKIPLEYLKEQVLLATIGEKEEELLNVENNWYNTYTKLERLTKELDEINQQLQTVTSEVERAPLIARKEELAGRTITKYDENGLEVEVFITGEIDKTKSVLEALESEYPWLQKYRGIETTEERPDVATGTVISNVNIKKLIAYDRDMTVRNAEDTLADLAKMNSLLFSVVSKIYEVLPSEQIDNISAEERAIIEYSLEAFKNINTRADLQLAEEGEALIDKLMDRENKIAEIVTKLKD